MTHLLIQQASGTYKPFLDLTYDRHRKYCDDRSIAFSFWRGRVQYGGGKGPTWCRIALLIQALEHYDVVYVLDADTLIVGKDDITKALPASENIGMVRHKKPWGGREWHWNCGVIIARQSSLPFWKKVWKQGNVPGQSWNEQSRVNDLTIKKPLSLDNRIFALDDQWNTADSINPVAFPVVKAWHGLHLAALPLMVEEVNRINKL